MFIFFGFAPDFSVGPSMVCCGYTGCWAYCLAQVHPSWLPATPAR